MAVRQRFASVAQLDRASDSDSEGRRFDSCQAHHVVKPFESYQAACIFTLKFANVQLLFKSQYKRSRQYGISYGKLHQIKADMLINRAYPFLHYGFFTCDFRGIVYNLLLAVIGGCQHIVEGFGCSFISGLYSMAVYVDQR